MATLSRRSPTLRPLPLAAPFLLLFAVGFLAPMGTVFWTSLHRGSGWSLGAYAEVLGSPVFLAILLRTLTVAVTTTAICVLLAYGFSYVVVTRAGRFATVLLALVAFPYLTSILVRSYAWIIILGQDGLINRLLLALGIAASPLDLVFNSVGTLVGMVHILLPLAVFPLYAAMQRIDPALINAARSLGGDRPSAFATVFLPLSFPGIVAAATLVFLSALGFYVTPALLGSANDYLVAQAIEVRVSLLAEFDTAAAQATILFLGVAALLVLLRRQVAAGGGPAPRRGHALSRSVSSLLRVPLWLRPMRRRVGALASALAGPLLWALFASLVVFLIAPLAIVSVIAFTSGRYLSFPPPGLSLRWFAAFLADARWSGAALFSLGLSFVSAMTALAVGTLLAFAIARPGSRSGRWLWLAAITPMIVPHILIGLGLFFIVVPLRLAGHPVAFWIGFTVIGIPYVAVIVLAAISRFDSSLARAAASLGARPSTVFLTVKLPLMRVAFASAFLFAFLAAFDDVVISLFLGAPGATTLPVRMWEDIRFDISPKTAVVATLQFAALALILLCAAALRARGRAPGPAGRHVVPAD